MGEKGRVVGGGAAARELHEGAEATGGTVAGTGAARKACPSPHSPTPTSEVDIVLPQFPGGPPPQYYVEWA